MKKHFPLLGTFLCLAVIIGAKEANAWGKTWLGIALRHAVDTAKWNLGPFRIDPTFYLSDLGYDSNLFYGHGGSAVKDYTVTVGPGLNIFLPIKNKVIFQIYESPQYAYCYRTKSERTWNNYFNAKVSLALNKIFISAGKGLTDAKQRWNTEIDIRSRLKQDSWEGSLLFQATKRTSFYVRGTQTTFRYENLFIGPFNIRDRLNRREDRLSLLAYYQFSRRTRLFFEGEYATYKFLEDVSRYKNSQSHGYFAGFEFSPLGIIRGRISLGYKSLEPQGQEMTRFKGLCGDSSASVRLLRFLVVRGSYSRDIQFSLWYNNAYYLESLSGVGLSFYVSKQIRLDYDYKAGKNRYPVIDLGNPGRSVKRRDDYLIHSIGIYFRLKKNVAIGLIANRWNRDSNLEWEKDDRDFIGANITYDF
jgi:hypothetical protein